MIPPSIGSPACLPQELVSSPVFLLGRLGFEIKRRAIEELEAAGSSMYHYSVLALLGEGACSAQAAIADVLKLDRSQLVGRRAELAPPGWIARRRDPSDRRRHTVTLTAEGSKQLARLREIVRRIEDDFLSPLEPESRDALYGLLLQVARHHDARFSRPTERAAAVV
jgi:DNA-binding MarR family transcriptional regulator